MASFIPSISTETPFSFITTLAVVVLLFTFHYQNKINVDFFNNNNKHLKEITELTVLNSFNELQALETKKTLSELCTFDSSSLEILISKPYSKDTIKHRFYQFKIDSIFKQDTSLVNQNLVALNKLSKEINLKKGKIFISKAIIEKELNFLKTMNSNLIYVRWFAIVIALGGFIGWALFSYKNN